MKYTAKPIEVEAQRITELYPLDGPAVKPGKICVTLENGDEVPADSDDGAEEGDFYVTWPNGEYSVYPAEEFEERFSPADSKQQAA